MEQINGVKIVHGRNGREHNLPESHGFNIDGYCPETRTIYEFSIAIGTAISVSRSVTFSP